MTIDLPQLSLAEAEQLALVGKPGELELAVARGQLDDVRAAAQARVGGALEHLPADNRRIGTSQFEASWPMTLDEGP